MESLRTVKSRREHWTPPLQSPTRNFGNRIRKAGIWYKISEKKCGVAPELNGRKNLSGLIINTLPADPLIVGDLAIKLQVF